VVPAARRAEILRDATARLAREAAESLDAWEQAHHARIEKILTDGGFAG
jgi:4-hydroxy-4-methyl-2-oxoglutarate aldolase